MALGISMSSAQFRFVDGLGRGVLSARCTGIVSPPSRRVEDGCPCGRWRNRRVYFDFSGGLVARFAGPLLEVIEKFG